MQNILQDAFNPSLEGYRANSAFAADVHTSVHFSAQFSKQPKKQLNPLGNERTWSKVEKDIVGTFNDFTKEYIRQIDIHLKTFNNHLAVDTKQAGTSQSQEKRKLHQEFVAREEMNFWQEFPRNKKFYHSYLRKLYTLFNQCRMPDSLLHENTEDLRKVKNENNTNKLRTAYIRDIQLILSLCLDLMPQASQNYTERIEAPMLSLFIQNVWELTDFPFNESKGADSGIASKDTSKSRQTIEEEKDKSHNTTSGSPEEAIFSGGNIASFIGGLEGLKASGIDMDREARHLRKYLYQNRIKFDQVTEELKMFEAENLKNWLLLGNLMTIMVSDVIQIFLSTQENIKVSLGIVEALMTYSGFFSQKFKAIERDYYDAVSNDTRTIFDFHQHHIQFQWAQIFGQLSKLSTVTFDNCLGFMNGALITDHKIKKQEDIDDLAEQIFHSRFLHLQPGERHTKAITLLTNMLKFLSASHIKSNFKIVLLKSMRHLVSQFNFRDPSLTNNNPQLNLVWVEAINPIYKFAEQLITSKVFPGVNSANLNQKANQNHWDNLLESQYYQHVLLLIIQITKISSEEFYQDGLLRLMSWICLPEMLEHKKGSEFAFRLLMEISTPELYKLQSFMHWQPKILNHVFMLQNQQGYTPVVSHTDLQIFNQMPHRSPGLLNFENFSGQSYQKFRLSFQQTYHKIFDNLKQNGSVNLPHKQYLDLIAIYDIQFFHSTVIPDLLMNVDKETVIGQELLLLGLSQAANVLDPSLNFKQKYLTVHGQISEIFQNPDYVVAQGSLLDDTLQKLKSLMEHTLLLLVQSPIFWGKAAQDSLDFYKSSQYKNLCSDQMGVIYPSASLSLAKESEYVSKFLTMNGYSQYLIEQNQSSITFEDHVEIMGHHFENNTKFDPFANRPEEGRFDDFFVIPNEQYNEGNDKEIGSLSQKKEGQRQPQYIINDMNKITQNLDKEIGRKWDKKKESFTRKRLMAYLLEDRSLQNSKLNKSDSAKKMREPPKDSWLCDAYQIQEKQNLVVYGSNPCQKRQVQIKIKTQILKMLHYFPKVFDNHFVSPFLCKNLMLKEKDKIQELTDQTRPIKEQLNLGHDEYLISVSSKQVGETNLQIIDQLTQKLHSVSQKYSQELSLRLSTDQPTIGGSLRLTPLQGQSTERLQNVDKNILAMGLLSTDFDISSKTSKLLQKMMLFGSLETKVSILDQTVYIIKELMVEQNEDFHLAMYFQQLVSMIKLWHHTEIHKLQIKDGLLADLSGIQCIKIHNSKSTKEKQISEDSSQTSERQQTYPDISSHLYIFDLIDAVSLIGICNKEKLIRSLSLVLIQESSKLKRLIAGKDLRKSLADLLYFNELAIRERISEKMLLMKMFKFKAVKNDDVFTKAYSRNEIDQLISNLSFFKIIEDSFDYKQAKINESFARDVAVQYIGELATLWKSEFKTLLVAKKTKDNKLKRQHRIMGQKILNFVFNVSRRSILTYEGKMEAFGLREGGNDASKIISKNRKPPQQSKLMNAQKDHVGMNVLLALVLYNSTISSYNQIEPYYEDFEAEGSDSQEEAKQENEPSQENIDSSRPNTASHSAKSEKPNMKFRLHYLQDDLFNLVQMVNLDPSELVKVPSGCMPTKMPASSVLLSFYYLIQSPLPLALSDKRSQQAREQANLLRKPSSSASRSKKIVAATKLDKLDLLKLQVQHIKTIFISTSEENLDKQYLLNSVLFFTLLCVGSDFGDGQLLSEELTYLIKTQDISDSIELCEIIGALVDSIDQLLDGARQKQAADAIKSVLYSGWTKIVKIIVDKEISFQPEKPIQLNDPQLRDLLPIERQQEIVEFCQKNSLLTSVVHDWLIHKNRQSYQTILQLQHFISPNVTRKQQLLNAVAGGPSIGVGSCQASNIIQLDLTYLLSMQNLGYDVLQFFKLAENNSNKAQMSIKEQMVLGVNQIKMLVNSSYQYYTAQEDIIDLLRNPNPFYECFLNQIILGENETEKLNFLNFMQDNRFSQAYEKLTAATFNLRYEEPAKKRILIDTQVKKFVQYGVHSKFFLLTLTMSLNLRNNGDSVMQSQIERSRLVCLATLPLMFDDEEFREQVEYKISNMPDLSQIVQADNRDFFRLIKMMIKDEEQYNLQNHFERYFSISGFVRNLLNEIIKLQQSVVDAKIDSSHIMLIRVLDTLTYFMSQKGGSGLQLRRTPKNAVDQSAFLFDNLIDYKSFEFLSKLFKISEKLIEYDQDMVIMNMWYKLVENQRANYDILAKFLIHNLSSFMSKLKSQAMEEKRIEDTIASQDSMQYGIDYEKTKRYSINIFNYIKARVQRADIRNSIEVSQESPTWSKKMIELLGQAQLNIQSKYVLEKVKLKKVLQTMHREINQTRTTLTLKGGLDTECLSMQFTDQPGEDLCKQSVRMSQLLQSQTFLNAFSSQNKQEQAMVNSLLFHVQRIMKEKFVKVAPSSQLNQFNDLLIKYFENSLIFIANDTDRQLQFIQFTKEQELTVVVVMLILIGHLMMNHSETRYKHLIDIFKTLQSNISGLAPFFYLNTLSPRQLHLGQDKTSQKDKTKSKIFAERILTLFNYKNLFDYFDSFTKIFFTVTSNISSDSELRMNLMELYLQIFRGLKEVQSQKLNSQRENVQNPLIQMQLTHFISGKNLREIILSMMRSAIFILHEVASVHNKMVQTGQSQVSGCKNFRQHIQTIIDYTLDACELDRLKANQKSQAKTQNQVISSTNDSMSYTTRQILFASNTLFWLGIACLEAPQHLIEDSSQKNHPFINQIQQIQHFGMLAVRRTFEDTSIVKYLSNFEKLSTQFYSYSLQMETQEQSFMNILLNSMCNPLCTRDALKTLYLSIRIQDTRLLVGKKQHDLDEENGQELMESPTSAVEQAELFTQAVGKVEMIRLLYLVPYFMQQLTQTVSQQDIIFQNPKNMIQFLKKSLPSIGINKKSTIFEILDVISRMTANYNQVENDDENIENQELKEEFQKLIQQTIDLIYEEGFKGSLMNCYTTFKKLYQYQLERYGPQHDKHVQQQNEHPIKLEILQFIIQKLEEVFADDDKTRLAEQNAIKKTSHSIFNQRSEILGEEVHNYRPEFRALYFSLKNIILREIENSDKDFEVSQFFKQDAYEANQIQNSNKNVKKKDKKRLSQRMSNLEPITPSQIPTSSDVQNEVQKLRSPIQKTEENTQYKIYNSPTHSQTIVSKYQTMGNNQDTAEEGQIAKREPLHRDQMSKSQKSKSKSKSKSRYHQDDENLQSEDGDKKVEISNIPDKKLLLKRTPEQKQTIINENESLVNQMVMEEQKLEQILDITSKKSFADMSREQSEILQVHQTQIPIEKDDVRSQHHSLANAFISEKQQQLAPSDRKQTIQNIPNQNNYQNDDEDNMLTFQQRQPREEISQTMNLPIKESKIELPVSNFDQQIDSKKNTIQQQLEVGQQQSIRTIQEQESFTSKDQRRFYQAPIDPLDNQSQLSQKTVAEEITCGQNRPQTPIIQPGQTNNFVNQAPMITQEDLAKYHAYQQYKHEQQRQEQIRPQTQQFQPKTVNKPSNAKTYKPKEESKKPQPSALQPNFVADKSHQIWSDVASQKSQVHAMSERRKDTSKEKQEFLDQNKNLIAQMNARGNAVLDDRQSEKSFTTFTQMSQNQKYNLNEANFDFSSGEIHKKNE